MKPSLEDERRALLEQIEASRAVYRRMLSSEPEHARARSLSPRDTPAAQQGHASARAMQWMMDHPLWVAGGVALIVLLAPRVIGTGRRSAHDKAMRRREPERSQGGTLRALLTASALLLRDPARLRSAARIAQTAWQWMQRRRAASPPVLSSSRASRLH